ncbi:hypothetical protein V8C86DRAFT_2932102 [Haematococcus lacustris]
MMWAHGCPGRCQALLAPLPVLLFAAKRADAVDRFLPYCSHGCGQGPGKAHHTASICQGWASPGFSPRRQHHSPAASQLNSIVPASKQGDCAAYL